MKAKNRRKTFDRDRATDSMYTRKSMFAGLKADSEEEWREFYQKYWQWLVAHARADLPGQADAEDMAQKVLIKVYKAMPKFQYDPKRGSFRGWLLTILDNAISDFWKVKGRKSTVRLERLPGDTRKTEPINRIPQVPPAHWPEPAGGERLRELIDEAKKKLRQQVTPVAYQMFHRLHFEDASSAEIAKEFHCSMNAVYTRNSHTLSKFRIIFKKLLAC